MTTTANNSIYTSTKINVKGQGYTVLVVTGLHNYVSVSKDMPNTKRATLGRDFKNFDDAVKFYKSPEMKTELLKVEMGLA